LLWIASKASVRRTSVARQVLRVPEDIGQVAPPALASGHGFAPLGAAWLLPERWRATLACVVEAKLSQGVLPSSQMPATRGYAAAVKLSVPDGWYFLAPSASLPASGVMGMTLGGERRVLWRHPSGQVHLHDGFCPHLGADLGALGKVCDGALECPFHGFAYGEDGQCVRTGYGTPPPPMARLNAHPVVEQDGLILGWCGRTAPTWQVPELNLDGWVGPHLQTLRFAGHPQETSENSVDSGHFSWVHGYKAVESLAPVHTEGPHLKARYGFVRPYPLGPLSFDLRQEIDVHLWGLGYSLVHVNQLDLGLRIRLLVLSTPEAEGRVALTLGIYMQEPRHSEAARAWLRWLPRAVIGPALPSAMQVYVKEVEADIPFWEQKTHIQRPALAAGDGPVGPYRRWVRQFYEAAP
jgi:nitrite reductase/ring-hydroxylating ferredoxin subunit